MSKKHKKMLFPMALTALTIALAGCTQDENDYYVIDQEVTKQDVYKTLDDCMADWGDAQLCQAQPNPQGQQVQQSGSTTFMPIILGSFSGPEYHYSDRKAIHNGKVYNPKGTHAYASTKAAPASAAYMATKSSFFKSNPTIAKQAFPGTTNMTTKGGMMSSSKSSSGSVKSGSFGGAGKSGGFGGG